MLTVLAMAHRFPIAGLAVPVAVSIAAGCSGGTRPPGPNRPSARRSPIQHQRLPDGTVLALEAVTYGKDQQCPENGHLRPVESGHEGGDTGPFVYHSPYPVLLLWVVQWGRDVFESPYISDKMRAVVSDERDWRYSLGITDQGLGTPVASLDAREEGDLNVWVVHAFPRRAKTFRVGFFIRGRASPVATFLVRNPAPGNYPPLTPELLPVSKQSGDVAFCLERLLTDVPPAQQPRYF